MAKWSEQTSDDFRFTFKLPRTVTHNRRLCDVGAEVRSFLDVIEPLGQRIGPVQVQLPGSFGPADLDALLAFLRRLPPEWPWALELRHRGFFDRSTAHQAVDELCLERDIGRVVLDTRPLYAVAAESAAALDEQRKKPDLPIVLDAIGQSPIVRVIGEDAIDGTMRWLLAWVPQIVEWLTEGRMPYVFVHQPENLESPGLARALHEAVAAELPALTPLPTPPGQTSMF